MRAAIGGQWPQSRLEHSAEVKVSSSVNPIGIYYEHPRWFVPVFAELDRRGIPYVRLDAARSHFDLTEWEPALRADFQPDESVGMDARECARNFLHA